MEGPEDFQHEDHPLTRIMFWKHEVYGREADDLIRKCMPLSNRGEVHRWWEQEVGEHATPEVVLQKVRAHYEELLQRAKENGWELP